jgi:hypothetical protein
MQPDGLRSQPCAGATVYHETPEAWEILAILDRQLLPIDTMLDLLAGFHSSDLHAAYWLTRRHADLVRQNILVDGVDAGRAARIRARNILARARHQSLMAEQTQLLEEASRAVLEDIRGSPPAIIGTHLRSIYQVLLLAGSPQPLSVRLRRLLAVHPQRLEAARQRILTLPDNAWLRGRWPSRLERPHMRRVMKQATMLQHELLANREP